MTQPLSPIGTVKKCEALAAQIYPGKKDDKSCNVCGAYDVKLWTCSGCKFYTSGVDAKVFYCSRSCQRSDWEAHKWYCKPLSVKGSFNARMDAEDKSFRKRFLDEIVPQTTSFPIKNWAAYQAFLANPQHDPRTTCLEITMKPIKLGHVVFPDLPVTYTFRPLKPGEATVYWHDQTLDENRYGYWRVTGRDVVPIQNASLEGFMLREVPQWPYIAAKAIAADQRSVAKAVGYWIYLLGSVTGQKDALVLNEYSAPRFEKTWELNLDKFYEWMRLTRNIMPS